MYARELIGKFLFLDIETVSVCGDLKQLNKLNPKMVELWNKRVVFLRERYSDNMLLSEEEIFQRKGALHSEFGKIICISFSSIKSDNTVSTVSITADKAPGAEKALLEKAMSLIERFMAKAGSGGRIVGHNIKRFDIPVLCKRALINSVEIPEILHIAKLKPWEQPIIDTCELWSHGAWQEGFVSLDLLCAVLGVKSPKGEFTAADVQDAYYRRDDIETIKSYCEGDVMATLNVLLRMCGHDTVDQDEKPGVSDI